MSLKLSLACCIILSLTSPGTGATPVALTKWKAAAEWRLIAVEYARSKPLSTRRLVVGAPARSKVAMSWYFFIVLGHSKVVLVDSGTDVFAKAPRGYLARKWRVAWSRGVRRSLRSVGLKPGDVTDVVLTHRHWDHVGGVVHFPRAEIHMHAKEWPAVSPKVRKRVAPSRRRLWRGRRAQAYKGIAMRVLGRHTRFHSVVEVRCRDRVVILAGDGAYLWDNLTHRRAITVTTARRKNVREMAQLVRRVGVWNVIPGHDPRVFTRYPGADSRVAFICR